MKYIIINKTSIQKRIEELENIIPKWQGDKYQDVLIVKKDTYKSILSQSTPLVPEIEKSINYGFNIGGQISKLTPKMLQDYISNLKLDI